MQIHNRGIELLVNAMDASDHLDELSREDMRRLLDEVIVVLGRMLERDALHVLKQEKPPEL